MRSAPRRLLILTDLDGTLLDHRTYSHEAALPSLRKIREYRIPLVIVSSKTRVEIEAMAWLPALSGIFVTENGSAVFLDKDLSLPAGMQVEARGPYNAVILGRPHGEVLGALGRARAMCGAVLKGFSEMTAEEVSGLMGLGIEAAARAKKREFSEPFLWKGGVKDLACLQEALEGMGMSCLDGGRLFHALGKTDKGAASRLVTDIVRGMHPGVSWKTVALGDGPNDAAMLRSADVAVVIRRPDGSFLKYDPAPSQQIIVPSRPGPEGWSDAVLGLLDEELSR